MEISRRELLQLHDTTIHWLLSLVDTDVADEVMLVLNGLQEYLDLDTAIIEQLLQVNIVE